MFDHQNTQSWVELHKGIAQWMSSFVQQRHHTQDWEWGQEAYWMAFAATYTNFPTANWPSWDTTVELEGPFIQGWFYRGHKSTYNVHLEYSEEGSEDSEDSEDLDKGTPDRDRNVQKDLWQRFCVHVWSGYSIFI
ncbi:hypothetical protein E1B28_000146 [Marasmius oreades]|uniref:Uncharacterized protein n=1 Tax=Marasmius oreades TaxID=181124 RepID=A0A9P7V0T2_9AGAR|nr:uncharacterized protein E1B28_000146 [Marasmius oreades]KAG7098178.1 hypothetical protein E1B28_000146 [Marasmius oreades]